MDRAARYSLTRAAHACPAWPGCGGAGANVAGNAEGTAAFCSVPGCAGTLLSTKRPNPNCLKRLRKATMSLSLRFGTISLSQVQPWRWEPQRSLPPAAILIPATRGHDPAPAEPPGTPHPGTSHPAHNAAWRLKPVTLTLISTNN